MVRSGGLRSSLLWGRRSEDCTIRHTDWSRRPTGKPLRMPKKEHKKELERSWQKYCSEVDSLSDTARLCQVMRTRCTRTGRTLINGNRWVGWACASSSGKTNDGAFSVCPSGGSPFQRGTANGQSRGGWGCSLYQYKSSPCIRTEAVWQAKDLKDEVSTWLRIELEQTNGAH